MFRLLALILAVAISTFSSIYYWGPCRYLAEIQQETFHVEYVNLTIVFGIVAALAFLYPLGDSLDRRFEPEWVTAGAVRLLSWERWPFILGILPKGYAAGIALFSVMPIVFGTIFLIRSLLAEPPKTIDMSSITRGERPPGRYVILENCAVITTRPMQQNNDTYYPVVSYGANETRPIHAFVSEYHAANNAGPINLEGSVEFGGLPGAIEVWLEDRKLLASRYFVIKSGDTRKHDIESCTSMIRFFGILLLLCFSWSEAGRYIAAKRHGRKSNHGHTGG